MLNKKDDNLIDELQSASDIEQLKRLLFHQELETLERLKKMDDPRLYAKEISKVIAEAIMLRNKNDDQLAMVLRPTIENVFKSSVKSSKAELANSIFPLMGPAIRKAISEGFRGMLESFNQTIELSFTWKGLKWRLEALKSGKTFSEVVLLHTLVYQVEQVYLIHSETGILLGHVAADGVSYQDGDLVSGMLTAVQEFVKDCFTGGKESFQEIQMGDRALIIEAGSQVSLAFVVRGILPTNVRERFRDILDIIHINMSDELEEFSGDIEPFRRVKYLLEDCLIQKFSGKERGNSIVKILAVSILVFTIIFTGVYLYFDTKFNQLIKRMGYEPGILVMESKGNFISGWELDLRVDPLARDPLHIVNESDMNPAKILLLRRPYISIESSMVNRRIASLIAVPDGYKVDYSFSNGTLKIYGEAPSSWIIMVKDRAETISGVEKVDISGLYDPKMRELIDLAVSIDGTEVFFDLGKDVPSGGELEKLNSILDVLDNIDKLSKETGTSVFIVAYGHTDKVGTEKVNYLLSQSRVNTLASMMYNRGIAVPIATFGFGADHSGGNNDRKMVLRVHINGNAINM